MTRLLVLVADQAHARLYKAESLRDTFTEVEGFANHVARYHEQQLVSDAPGRSSSPGNTYSHPLGNEQEARQHNLALFAKTISGEIGRALYNQTGTKLYLIAPPKFLGVLRNNLSNEVRHCVAGELNKSITDVSPEKLAAYIKDIGKVLN